ncbi:MAG: lipoprotein-releasing ABC transporter permease subunit [Proteobacteria bacterium]|nr:lipoprotein-releasing ABC transporter permease subunit [Pseudomonadota bacterium]
MFQPLALYIGLRYTRAKRRNHFISFISLVSMLGIALGVAVLITVLSVMNGFDEQIEKRFFSLANHVTVRAYNDAIPHWQTLKTQISKNPEVVGVAPFVGGQALLASSGQNLAVFVMGIDPSQESSVSELNSKMIEGSIGALKPGTFGILLGRQLADSLALQPGDKVNVIVPQVAVTPVALVPRFKRFTVVGIFSAGNGFGYDSKFAFINLTDGQKLFGLGQNVTGMRIKIQDLYHSISVAQAIARNIPKEYYATDWTQQYGELFATLRMEKTVIFTILTLIIAVATFNLVSSLVMLVTDKQSDIAILRTLGVKPKTILAVFMVQGTVVGLLGTLLGLIGGIILALNATAIVDWIQHLFSVQFVTSEMYFVDYLPSKLQLNDVVMVCCIALIFSFLATIYPAWRASRVQPAEALRYE